MVLLPWGGDNGHCKALIKQRQWLKHPRYMAGLHMTSPFSNFPLLPSGWYLGAAYLGVLSGAWAEGSGGQKEWRDGWGSSMRLCAG